MTIEQWLSEATGRLSAAGIGTAQLDAEVLLSDTFRKDRSWLHAHSNHPLTRKLLIKLERQIARREKHEPLAYVRGKQEFFSREFYVSPDTLTPRPETETMLEMLIQHNQELRARSLEELQIVDVGTGSGCIIITAALELSKNSSASRRTKISYCGLDISKPALKIARKNADKFKVEVDFKEFDLTNDSFFSILSPQPSTLVVLANLPYVPTTFKINLAASHEPAFAIYGGEDGLDHYRTLFSQLKGNVCTIFTESLPPQHNKLQEIAEKTGFQLQKTQNFIQMFSKI